MAINTINVGNLPNDGTGDDLREAFIKVNNNFVELDSAKKSLEVEGNNLGTSVTAEGVFANKTENILNFKSLQAGSGVSLNANSTSITIDADVGISSLMFLTDSGSVVINDTTSSTVSFEGGSGIVVEKLANPSNTIRVRSTNGVLAADSAPKLSENLDVDFNNITRANSVTANNFYGDLTGLVHGVDVRDINEYLFENTFDFGKFLPVFTNILDYIIYFTEVDLGTFDSETDFEIELGTW